MKIEHNEKKTYVDFSSIVIVKWFESSGRYYMKTKEQVVYDYDESDCINCVRNDGTLSKFYNHTRVVPLTIVGKVV